MVQKLKLMGCGTSSKLADQSAAGTVTLALTATGSTSQSASFQIIDDVNEFTTVSSGNGARLPADGSLGGEGPTPGDIFFIENGQATNALLLYPPLTGKLNNLAANTSISMPASKSAFAVYKGSNNYTVNLSA